MNFREIPFDPCPFLSHPHIQTLISAFFGMEKDPGSQSIAVALPDGDQLVAEVTTPEGWKGTDLTLVCVPGFCGCHEDSSMIRLATRFSALGVRVVRFNVRGAGSGRGLSQEVYDVHFGKDVLAIIRKLKEEAPLSPVTVLGYSLGGNVVLKMMGDLGKNHNDLVNQVIAIAPPVDLNSNMGRCHQLHEEKDWWMVQYDRYFYRETRKKFVLGVLPEEGSMPSFFRDYVIPKLGFKDVDTYFSHGSAIHTLREVEIPCKILFAEDDPIVLHHLLDSHELPSHIEVFKTKKGGHLGYLGNPFKPEGFYWLDSLLVNWVLDKNAPSADKTS